MRFAPFNENIGCALSKFRNNCFYFEKNCNAIAANELATHSVSKTLKTRLIKNKLVSRFLPTLTADFSSDIIVIVETAWRMLPVPERSLTKSLHSKFCALTLFELKKKTKSTSSNCKKKTLLQIREFVLSCCHLHKSL